MLHLTDLSDESLQSQIARQIRAQILSGDMKAGADLPSIRRLAREQHVSVITVQRAYEHLERQGLIHSRRGKGFFVSELSDSSKMEMAREKLRENLHTPIESAMEEGMGIEDILSVTRALIVEMDKNHE